ncbi:hypothetical protein BC832DRAFT_565296 [Gaertneriomyces semiglobifer]|nr:hypothetical protein BC832DRAFT_565296 [Gaertneriomyces semiglobifer]
MRATMPCNQSSYVSQASEVPISNCKIDPITVYFQHTASAEIAAQTTEGLYGSFKRALLRIKSLVDQKSFDVLNYDDNHHSKLTHELNSLRQRINRCIEKSQLSEIFAEAHRELKLKRETTFDFRPLVPLGFEMMSRSNVSPMTKQQGKRAHSDDLEDEELPASNKKHQQSEILNVPTSTLTSLMQAVMQQTVQFSSATYEKLIDAKDEVVQAKNEALEAQRKLLAMSKYQARKAAAAEQRITLLHQRARIANEQLAELQGIVSNRTRLESVAALTKKELGLPPTVGVEASLRRCFHDPHFQRFQHDLCRRA